MGWHVVLVVVLGFFWGLGFGFMGFVFGVGFLGFGFGIWD